ncbi:MAG: hypothetical protein MJ069_01750 [Salinivirgaceae bacterium]|nr:hypothetical protein [Salinivirgaceae bacterium]
MNGASLLNTQTLEKELNKIFKPAVASVKVSTHSGITIDYANGSGFAHQIPITPFQNTYATAATYDNYIRDTACMEVECN